jgi:tRNA (guanosine-2'-O-)-methyltransferase
VRRELPEVSPVSEGAPLPAPPRLVIEALQPMLSPRRLGRIDAVIEGRTDSVTVVLDSLIDPYNMSAVLRSAEAFGIQQVQIIEGEEPFVTSSRVTTGAERWLDLRRHRTAESCAAWLRRAGFKLFVASPGGGLAPAELRDAAPRLAIAFGNEHQGISRSLHDLADGTCSVPMSGFVESLNVSVAAAVVLQAAARGRGGDLSAERREALRARFLMLSVDRSQSIVEEHLRRKG